MKTLASFLHDRILQLENRLMMIPRYLERPEAFVGKKDYSLDDMPIIQKQIEEAKMALAAVNKFNKERIRSHGCQCKPGDKHGETSVMCCNECGLPTEDFWIKQPVE